MRALVGLILRFGIIELFVAVFILINVVTFLLYAMDKRKAIKNKWRISERVLIFFTLALGGFGALLAIWFLRHKTKKKKFKIALVIGVLVALIPVVHIVHSLTLDRIIRFVEIDFGSANWPYELEGYRIAFMTDMHTISTEGMQGVADELNQKNIDLLILGGDFSMADGHYRNILREISQINTTDGIFGVEGNHDDYARLFEAKNYYGIVPLDNSGLHIAGGFYLAGVQDMWNRNPNITQAINQAYADDFILLVSHNPDIAMLQPTSDISLILAGHTHGGQITLFGFPFYLLRGSITNYGTRFAYGFAYSADNIPVFVSRGIGVYYDIPRVFARPEVVIFTMHTVIE